MQGAEVTYIRNAMTFHPAQTAIFSRAHRKNMMHHAWLLTGAKGIGKATWAKGRAASLLETPLEHLEYHTHFLKLGSRDEPLTIDQLRDAKAFFTHISLEDKYKIILIDHVDDINEKTINALLKILEEPPEQTVFMLVSHQPHLLLPTIHSRTINLRFNPLTIDETRDIVDKHINDIEDDTYKVASNLYPGQPGKIINFIENGFQGILAKFQMLLEGKEIPEFDKEEETKEAFYLLSKLIHKKKVESLDNWSYSNPLEISPNRVIHDCFLYNLDKKTAMMKLLKSI